MAKKKNSRSSRKDAWQKRQAQEQSRPSEAAYEPDMKLFETTPANASRHKYKREWFPSASFGGSDFMMALLFMFLWSACAFVEWFILRAIGVGPTPAIVVGIILGLITSCIIVNFNKIGPGAGINMSGWGDPWS